jgi:hypothetical protein
VDALRSAFLSKGVYTHFLNTDGNIEGTAPLEILCYTAANVTIDPVSRSNYVYVFNDIYGKILALKFLGKTVSVIGVDTLNSTPLTKSSGGTGYKTNSCSLEEAIAYLVSGYNAQSNNVWWPITSDTKTKGIGIYKQTAHSHVQNETNWICSSVASLEIEKGRVYVDLSSYPINWNATLYVMTKTYSTTTNVSWNGPVGDGLVADNSYHTLLSGSCGTSYCSSGYCEINTISAGIIPITTNECKTLGWYIVGGRPDSAGIMAQASFALITTTWDTTPDDVDCCDCSVGGFGGMNISANNGVQISFNLGIGYESGKRAGTLFCHEQRPNERLFKPSGLQINAPLSGYSYSYLGDYSDTLDINNNNYLEVTKLSSTAYTLSFCVKGLADPLNTVTVSMGSSTNELQVVETTGETSRTNLFTYSPASSEWTLARGANEDVKTVRSSVWDSTNTNQVDTVRMLDGATLVSQTVETNSLFPWGQEITGRVRGTGTNVLTEIWTYYDTITNLVNTNN